MNKKDADSVILLVDDNELNREVINMQLSALGYSAMAAVDGHEALQLWHQHSFAMVLTDCHMPVMNGFELAAAIREAEKARDQHIPIIAFTANTVDEERDSCASSGMDACLTKPIELDALERLLMKWMPTAIKSEHD
jgi:CheY-like chemotaxis protein